MLVKFKWKMGHSVLLQKLSFVFKRFIGERLLSGAFPFIMNATEWEYCGLWYYMVVEAFIVRLKENKLLLFSTFFFLQKTQASLQSPDCWRRPHRQVFDSQALCPRHLHPGLQVHCGGGLPAKDSAIHWWQGCSVSQHLFTPKKTIISIFSLIVSKCGTWQAKTGSGTCQGCSTGVSLQLGPLF